MSNPQKMTPEMLFSQEKTYTYDLEIPITYLIQLNLLNDISFKYIEEYLPFDESCVDFEWEGVSNGCEWEFDIHYKFTLYNFKKNLEKVFIGEINNINTSSPNALIFMELREIYDESFSNEENDE